MNLWLPDRAGGPNLPRAGLPSALDLAVPGVGVLCRDGRYEHAQTWTGPRRLRVLASLDPTPHGELLHVSVSRPDSDPSWGVIHGLRDAFYPASVDVMLVLPRREDYVNVHPHCFHLWQCPARWGLR